MMKISIVIPVYNVAPFIERCLHSAFNQTYTDIEYILVDDAGTDNSMELVSRVIAAYLPDKDIKIVVHPENKGLGAARNTGVKEASGEYIFFLDSDDELFPNTIELLVKAMADNPVDLVIGEVEVVGNERTAYPPLLLSRGEYGSNRFIFDSFLKRQWYEMAWNKLIKRDLFTKLGLWFNESILHEDTLWSFHVASQIESLVVASEETYRYHIQGNSITQKKAGRNIDSFRLILEEIIDESKQKGLFESFPALFNYLEDLRMYFIKNIYQNSFGKTYRKKQKRWLDDLFRQNVWPRKKRKLSSRLKEFGWIILQTRR